MDNLLPQPQNLKIDLAQAEWVSCEQGNKAFDSKMLFKRIPSIMSPTGKEEFFPIEVVICSKCGKVPKFYYDRIKELPDDMKSECKF